MRLLLLGLLLIAGNAFALTAGPGCSYEWDYADPLPADVDGFRLYCDGGVVYTGTQPTVTCAAAGTEVVGPHSCYAVAYNASGESTPSNTLDYDFVTGGPSAPLNLRFTN